ncbi:MAG TPA: bifunctional serine/threonine-protein kinase/formylglycine-generating enzyme family protein [Pirellulales bacterium]|nr:bifunctional serine/threonine-protein kinase/formylglycine-generating enzyme family protein [Pirellulales bacterium]
MGPRRTFTSDLEDEDIDFLAPAQAADELGRLGNYRVLRVLGSGGMGVVFEAEDLQLKRRVALKAMKPSLAASSSSRKRFVREAQTAASVEHDHIVPIYQVGDDRGIPFIAMPLLRGETLADRLQKGSGFRVQVSATEEAKTQDPRPKTPIQNRKSDPLPLPEILRIGREIALGLDAAHRAGLIHRDIKPGNIWLDAANGRAKILDFGLARAAGADDHLTQTGALLGTPSYMAPEQGRGEEIDARADLFSLGCLLYHIATGVRPFVGRDTLSTLLAVTTHEPRPPRELNAELPAELNELIVWLLSKDPAGRPQTASEVAERLASVGNGLRGVPEREGRLPSPPRQEEMERQRDAATERQDATLSFAPSLLPSVSPSPLPSLAPTPPAPPRRRGLVAVAAAAAAVLAGVVFFLQTNNGTLRVEINDPQIEVSVKGTDITFKQADNGADVKVSPGDKTLVVERGDFKFETDKLLLKRGDAVTVAVTLSADRVEVKLGDKLIGQRKLPEDLLATKGGATTAEHPANENAPPKDPRSSRTAPGWHGWPADAPAPAIAPFDAAQAKKHQQAWADYLKLPVEHTNSIGMKFVLIPPGEFTMGSTLAEIEEHLKVANPDDKQSQECIKSQSPQHKVVLTRPFYLATREVTQKEYEVVTGVNPSYFAKTGLDNDFVRQVADLDTANFPVDGVSWNDAAEFCNNLGRHEALKPFYFRADDTVTPLKGNGYRLPTEAEWEFACRAGTTTKFWTGDREEDLISAGWFGRNSGGRTHQVAELAENPLGLFDVHGNVLEWIEDSWQAASYEQFAGKQAIDPKTPSSRGSLRLFRGGDWGDSGSACQSAHHFSCAPTGAPVSIGFRLVLVVDALRGDRLAAKPQPQAPKTEDPSPKISAINPKSKIQNRKSKISQFRSHRHAAGGDRGREELDAGDDRASRRDL